MKVCIVNTFYYPDIIGGAEISVLKLAEGLKNKNVDVIIIATGKEDKQEFINGVKVYRLKINNMYNPMDSKTVGFMKKIIYRSLDLYNIFNYKKLENILLEENVNIVHTNNLYGISPIIWNACKKNNIKIVHTLRDYYLACPKTNLLKNKKNTCNKCRVLCRGYRKLNISLMKKLDAVTAPSKFTLKLFNDSGYNENVTQRVIYNSIDFNINEINNIYNNKNKNKNKEINYIFMGAIDYHKGIQILLEAFNNIKNPNIKLHIAGRGKLEYMVKEYVDKDERIIYHGFLNEIEKQKLLISMDVMIVPSIWYEPFGRVVIDGYKYCMPVIGSNIGGIPEIIENGKTGLLILPNSKNHLKQAIEYFSNSNNIKNMLSLIRNYALKFNLDNQIDEFISLYRNLTE